MAYPISKGVTAMGNRRWSRLMGVLCFCFVAAAVLAPTPSWAEDLLVYTALEDDQIPCYLESFKKQYPDIAVKIVRDSTGIVTAKLLAEKGNPQADVIWGLAATTLLILDQEGMLAPYAPKRVELVAPQFKDARNPPTWVGIDAWMTGFCVNTVESKAKGLPLPASFSDLVKPAYKGHLVMPNPASSGTGYLTVSAVLQMMGEQKGWEYLDKLHQNMAVYTHSGSKPCKQAAAGEFPIGISFGYRGIQEKKKGAPVETVFPQEGSGWDLEANALVKKGQIKPAARAFLDWALSEPVMKEYNTSYAVVSIPTGMAVPEGFPREPLKQMIKNDFSWAAKNRARILDEWNKSYALFPNLTAAQNIGYGLVSLRASRTLIRERVQELLRLVGLLGMEAKYPGQLSGGQQQRVALARAMALSPSLLLLDEPLSALDAQVRVTLRGEVKQLQRRLGVTTLMVTHDQEEALTMADRILVMEHGRIVQNGTPLDIYNKPATPFVAAFIGSMNFLRDAVKEAPGLFRLGNVRLRVENGSGTLAAGSRVVMAIRPEDIAVSSDRTDAPNTLSARVERLEFRGAHYRATLRLPLGAEAPTLQADLPAEQIRRRDIREAMDLPVHLPADRIRVYAE